MLAKLRRFLSLGAAERRRILEALAVLPLACLGLRFAGYRRACRFLERRTPGRSPAAGTSTAMSFAEARAWAGAVDAAGNNVPFRARCLERSLALCFILRRRGARVELRIGVRKPEEDELQAHAWVELDGRAINDTPDVGERYAAFELAGTLQNGDAPPFSGS